MTGYPARLTWEGTPMTLFRLDASINPATSSSRAIADIVEAEWEAAHPGGEIVRRNLGTEPLPATAWTGAVGASWTPTRAPRSSSPPLALAAGLAEELRSADAALLAVPLYNFGVPQHVKAWIDVVLAGAESANEPLLSGRPAVLVVVRGGAYGPGTPRDGSDHSTGYLRRIIADVWGADLTIVEREFTLVGVNPALDGFKDLAAELKDAATPPRRRRARPSPPPKTRPRARGIEDSGPLAALRWGQRSTISALACGRPVSAVSRLLGALPVARPRSRCPAWSAPPTWSSPSSAAPATGGTSSTRATRARCGRRELAVDLAEQQRVAGLEHAAAEDDR